MRPAAILVPLGVAFAVAGGVLYYASLTPASASKGYVLGEVRHEVTTQMLRDTGQMAAKPAPLFKLKDIHGKEVQLGGAGKRPQFVYFILKGCPCSLDAQPLFNALYDRYKGSVDFIGVINVGAEKALEYAGESNVLHPVVSDESKAIIKAYGAKQSVYNLIVKPDGSIEKMWPGYSTPMLKEINARLAKMTGTAEQPFDTKWAPEKMASGCYF